MTNSQGDERVLSGVRAALERAAERLAAAGARDEARAAFVPPRRVLFFTKHATMEPLGRVWRLGVFLLDREGALFATGAITRALEQGRSNHQSLSADSRSEYRAAAFRSSFTRGESVNFDAPAIPLELGALRSEAGLLFIQGGRAWVRWDSRAAAVEFDAYLKDRVALLLDPPAGA